MIRLFMLIVLVCSIVACGADVNPPADTPRDSGDPDVSTSTTTSTTTTSTTGS